MNLVIDKIDNQKQRKEKLQKRIKWWVLIIVTLTLAKFFVVSPHKLSNWGWWADTFTISILCLSNLLIFKNSLAKTGQQFIEWNETSIIYLLKEEKNPISIAIQKINLIDIQIDIIEITTINDEHFRLDISNFIEYEDRIKIKDNFQKLKPTHKNH